MTENPSIHSDLSSALFWVKGELGHSFETIRGNLESFIEEPQDKAPLEVCQSELHQVSRISGMVQCYSVAVLAAEMEQSLAALVASEDANQEPALQALIRASLRMADLVELLARGEADHAAVLLTEVNGLRESRGEKPIAAAGAFARYMRLRAPDVALPESPNRKPGVAQALASKHFPVVQKALAQFAQNQNAAAALQLLGKASEQMASVVLSSAGYQFWFVARGYIELVSGDAGASQVDATQLLTKVVQVVKAQAARGEDALQGVFLELAYFLLYLILRSPQPGEHLDAVRSLYGVPAEAISDEQLQALRARMEQPNVDSLTSVARELRSELNIVKDEIDLTVRAADRTPEQLGETRDRLARIGATLNVLGLETLAASAQEQATAIGLIGSNGLTDDSQWEQIAEVVLRIEQQLEGQLFDQAGGASAGTEATAPDLREGISAVLRESLVDIARVKSEVDAFITRGDSSHLGTARELLAEITAAMRILNKPDVVELMERLVAFVGSPGMQGVAHDRDQADRFADSIACIEYYIESQQEDHPHSERLLIDLSGYLDRMEAGASEVAIEAEQAEVDVAPQAVEVDPEFREIFIDEAGEVLGELQSGLPAWQASPEDPERLGAVRRAFHTLKGSGRMVGATDIGEYGWAIENMLNRCLDGGLSVSPAVVETVVAAVEQLPAIIEQFREGRPAGEEMHQLIRRAEAVTSGEALVEADLPSTQPDGELFEMFLQDSNEQVSSLQQRVSDADGDQVTVDDELVRGLHTLRGSSAAVGLEVMRDVSEQLESLASSARLAGITLPRALLQDAAETYGHLLSAAESGDPAPDVSALKAQIAEVQAGLPTEAVDAAVDQELIEIFSEEAADLLEAAEAEVVTWRGQPDASQPQQALQRIFHTLKGSARTATASGIGAVGECLDDYMKGCVDGVRSADADAIERVQAAIMGVYDLLDEFRNGQDGDATAIIAAFNASPSADAVDATMAVDVQAPPAEFVDATMAVDELAPAADPVDATMAVESMAAPAGLPTGAVDDDGIPADQWPPDADILDIFLAEGQDLVESIDRNFEAWESNLAELEPLRDMQRDLHTLKGSARMAGLHGFGAVAHEMESVLAGIERGAGAADPEALGRLHNATDGLYGLLDTIKSGQAPHGVAELVEALRGHDAAGVELVAEPSVVPTEDQAVEAAAPVPTLAAELPVAETTLPDGIDVAESDPEIEELVADDGAVIDADDQESAHAELVEIFLPEATELLEQFDQVVGRWREAPDDGEQSGEMLRILHTLKGGARMAGLHEMGDLTHQLESRIENMRNQGIHPGAEFFTDLSATSDRLHALRDEARNFAADAQSQADAEGGSGFAEALLWHPHDDERLAAIRRETARVTVEHLDTMLNEAGEISIYRSRMDEQASLFRGQLREVEQTIMRIRDQLRMLENETESQIQARAQGMSSSEDEDRYGEDFDPLEMDRYSRMQELTRALSESVTDLSSLHTIMGDLVGETETLLLQQGRVNTAVQQGLMSTLMVPFSRQVQRLQRVLRQTAQGHGKEVELRFSGIEAELDRNVLERMTPMLEHIIRNCVIHGVETPADRAAAGKPQAGTIDVSLQREGTMLAINIQDDGAGLDYAKIRQTAIKRGMISPDAQIAERELAQFIFEPGFSTAESLTKDAGRGVGMDVVSAQVKQLGGSLDLGSQTGVGARFMIRLPLSLAIAQALLVQVADELYAMPLATIDGVARIPAAEAAELQSSEELFQYGNQAYRVLHLAPLLGLEVGQALDTTHLPVILAHTGDTMGGTADRVAIVVDQLLGRRELVTKSVGPQVSTVTGVTGATILADGRVVLILDAAAMVTDKVRGGLTVEALEAPAPVITTDTRPLVMVIDDSITMRRVAERLLTRNDYRVGSAKDGMDAIAQLQTESPDIILLDIEMPKIDGFEVATFVRNNERLKDVPIIMITSRSGDKHRERAAAIGVNGYMIKPYQEQELIGEIRRHLDQPEMTIH